MFLNGENMIPYDFLVYLSGYLNQMDLSLDRSRWEVFSKLRGYYHTKESPKMVAEKLVGTFDVCCGSALKSYAFIEYNRFEKITLFFRKIIRLKIVLSESELCFLYHRLMLFEEMLSKKDGIEKEKVEKLRYEIAVFNTSILFPRLMKKDKKKILKVEHFLQSQNLGCISLEDL